MARDMVQVRRGGTHTFEGPKANIGRSQFNRSHGVKMSFDASYLYPFFLDEILPGDTMTMKLNGFVRMFSPLLAPVMDNIMLETLFFFCPTRILWVNWENFNGAHDAAGAQDTAFTIPVMATGLDVDHDNVKTVHALAAYLGLPHGLTSAAVTGVSALPFLMYNRVFNEWFRDQNLTAEIYQDTSNGPHGIGNFFLQRSNKKHDYFTSCLPYLQKGTAITAAVTILADPAEGRPAFTDSGGTPATLGYMEATTTADPSAVRVIGAWDAGDDMYWQDPGLIGAVDINDLRQSVAIQRLLEKDARGGTRYTEIIKTHFGVTSPDFRLQRTEYLGGGKAMINVSAVANTRGVDSNDSISGVDEPAGELTGVATGVITGHGWAKSFTEHGYLLGLVRARSDLTYFQGMDRLWSRSTRYDFYIPSLANLGEQSVLNQEIWVSNSSAIDIAVFGYQERWSEYRMKHSKVIGNFNPDITGDLGHWHLAEDFGTLPALNTAFMNDQTPMVRVEAVTTEPDFLLDLWLDYKCARPMPVRSIPSLTARF